MYERRSVFQKKNEHFGTYRPIRRQSLLSRRLYLLCCLAPENYRTVTG